MRRNWILWLIILSISVFYSCEKDNTECDYITIFEEDFELCSSNECMGWSGYYQIISCDSTDICGNNVMKLVAGWCPGLDFASTNLTGFNERNIIRLTLNYKLSFRGALYLYKNDTLIYNAGLNALDRNWHDTVFIDTISFNYSDTLCVKLWPGCGEVFEWNLLIDNVKIEKYLLGPCL